MAEDKFSLPPPFDMRCSGCGWIKDTEYAVSHGWVQNKRFGITYCRTCLRSIREWLTGLPDTEGDARAPGR